jgi:hypothetical protein
MARDHNYKQILKVALIKIRIYGQKSSQENKKVSAISRKNRLLTLKGILSQMIDQYERSLVLKHKEA